MMNGNTESPEDLFGSFASYLNEHIQNISLENGYERENLGDKFDKELHWEKLGLCFQAVSKECTKLVVGYSKPPVPNKEDCLSLISSTKEAVSVLWAWYNTLPSSEGKTLCKELEKLVYNTLDAVRDLILSVKSHGCSESPDRLTLTGKVWRYCEAFASMSKDNKSAAEFQVSVSYQLLDDALTEFEEELSNANNDNADLEGLEDDGDIWKDIDKPLFQPCLGLIKAAKKSLKMIKTCINSKGDIRAWKNIEQFDLIVEKIEKLSPSVDDLVLSLYPPVSHPVVIDNAKALAASIEQCLHLARDHHYTDENDLQWLDFIKNALNHNIEKLNNLQTT